MSNRSAAAVVVMDVEYEPGESGLDVGEAMLLLFGMTGEVHLRDASPVVYIGSDFDAHVDDAPNVWSGELTRVRQSQSIEFVKDDRGRYRKRAVETVPMDEQSTFVAFNEATSVLAFWERGSIPYTVVQSYVRRAARAAHQYPGMKVVLTPREDERALRSYFELFDKVLEVRIAFEHSKSPNDPYADQMLEELGAEEIRETIVADDSGPGLNVNALLVDGPAQLPQRAAINHIEQSSRNGVVTIVGRAGDDVLRVSTADPVTRRRVEKPADPTGFARLVASLLRR